VAVMSTSNPGAGTGAAGAGVAGADSGPANGISLKSRLAASERVFAETGHYQGLEKLERKERDPLEYERLYSRLHSTVVSAREGARRIAASPGVREVGEMVVVLYTPEGDAITLSTGILVHVHTTSRFIKWMINNDYEDDPGINPGDIFANNDAFIGDVQVPDVMDVIPVHHSGELVGWVGAVCHELEVGGITPGGDVALAQERFAEGLFVCAEKVGTNDDLRRDYVIRCERNLREPLYWIMDEKAKVSSCLEVRDRVLELIDEIGVDAYTSVVREYIEEGRRTQLDRMRLMTVPGRYRGVQFYGHVTAPGNQLLPLGKRELLLHMPMEMVVQPDGFTTLDFEGASPQGYHSMNCTPAGMDGGLFVTLTQSIGFDGKVNDGSYLGLSMNLPWGSWTNPDNEHVATATSWALLLPAFGCFQRLLSRAFYTRGFHEEVFVGQTNTPMVEGGGISQYGKAFGCALFECGAGGSGARAVMDGLDTGYSGWNPESDMGNAEIWEHTVPWVYLGRVIDPDSAGYGKRRGGVAFTSLWKIHKTPHLMMVTSEHSARVFDNGGLCGGYPASTLQYHYAFKEPHLAELVAERAPLPHQPEVNGAVDPILIERSAHGDLEVAEGVYVGVLKDGDLFSHSYNSGGGFGDPLDRDPATVAADAEAGLVSAGISAAVNGVVLVDHDGEFEVDEAATQARRDAIRAERLAESVPVAQWYGEQRQRLLHGTYDEGVTGMYHDCWKLSPAFRSEFTAFWGLDDDFDIRDADSPEPELEVLP
jgi:acetone carboxylase, alpha subunit